MRKILVAYFSASGETEKLAKTIASVTGGDLFAINPTPLLIWIGRISTAAAPWR